MTSVAKMLVGGGGGVGLAVARMSPPPSAHQRPVLLPQKGRRPAPREADSCCQFIGLCLAGERDFGLHPVPPSGLWV